MLADCPQLEHPAWLTVGALNTEGAACTIGAVSTTEGAACTTGADWTTEEPRALGPRALD